VYAAITIPHFDGTAIRSLGKNLARSQLGLVVIGAHDHRRSRNMSFSIAEEEPIGYPGIAFSPLSFR
jgi:hypothetical protein